MPLAHAHEPSGVCSDAQIDVTVARVGCESAHRLPGHDGPQLLIGKIDVEQAVGVHPPRTPAVFVHPRAHRNVKGGHLACSSVDVGAQDRDASTLGRTSLAEPHGGIVGGTIDNNLGDRCGAPHDGCRSDRRAPRAVRGSLDHAATSGRADRRFAARLERDRRHPTRTRSGSSRGHRTLRPGRPPLWPRRG